MSSDKMLSKEGAIVPPPTIVNAIPTAANDINLISEMMEILQLATTNI